MIRIKICGLTTVEAAMTAAEAGADAIGLVFAPSRRQVGKYIAREICRRLPPFVNKVGVFVDEAAEKVAELAAYCGLDTLQFHGSESPEYCGQFTRKIIRGFRIKDAGTLDELAAFPDCTPLLDSYMVGEMGGTGSVFPWNLAVEAAKVQKIILAGGLNEENVLAAIAEVKPYGVDVSSGVETNGQKDLDKIKRFIIKIRRWEYHEQ